MAGRFQQWTGRFMALTGITLSAVAAREPVFRFATGGETVYHLRAARVQSDGEKGIVAAAYSGKVMGFGSSGRRLWERDTSPFFPFDLDVGDIDGDGLDECAVASADGSLYLIDHDGRLLARVFDGKPPLYSVRIVHWGDGKTGIICGGVERVLYHLSPDGGIVSSFRTETFDTPWAGVIKDIDHGRFRPDGEPSLVVAMNMDWNRSIFSIHHLPDLKPDGPARTHRRNLRQGLGKGHYHMLAADTDGDGIDEIVFGGPKGGAVFAGDGRKLYTLKERGTGRGQHIYSMLIPAALPRKACEGEGLVGAYASRLRVYGQDGAIRKDIPLPMSPAGICCDEESRTLWLGSGMSGGDTITPITVVGLYAERVRGPCFTLRRNRLECSSHLTLLDAVIRFKLPGQTVVENLDRSVYLANVYAWQAGVISENAKAPQANARGNPSGWSHVREYSFYHGPESRLLDDRGPETNNPPVAEIRHSGIEPGQVPHDIVLRHVYRVCRGRTDTDTGHSVYRLDVARAGLAHHIIGSTWDGRLCAFDNEGNPPA